MQNHSEIADFLWKVADLIKDDYDAKDYEDCDPALYAPTPARLRA